MSVDARGQLLTAEQARLRAELRAALDDLGGVLEPLGASAEDRRLLAEAVRGLDELFLLVVVGEFNAGKSALLNELLGTRLLPEGVTPTTAAITLVRHGEREAEEWRGPALLERRLPADVLRDLAVVDTPGTNAIVRQHEALTREFVPRADLILFVTSADRPFTESERELLEAIREWGKKIVVVVNKIDLPEGEAAVEQVVGFVREGLQRTLGLTPPLFGVSVRRARLATESADSDVARVLRSQSGIDELRRYVVETLDEAERIRLKLGTPIGVAERLLQQYGYLVAERRAALDEDLRLVENVDRQVELYAEDLRRSFGHRLVEIENVVHELNDRGEQFFEDTVRLGRVFDLLNPERTRGAFERAVVGDAAARIDRLTGDVVDWFVEAEQRLWRQLSAMVRQRQQSAVGSGEDPDFVASRRDVLRTVSERTGAALVGFDREREARAIGQDMRDAVAQTALAEIGAVSLGAAIALLFGTVAADVTGLLAATLAAGLGLYILPARKRKALRQFRAKTEELRQRLVEAMQSALERELGQSTERVREAIAPYTRYVRAEGARLAERQAALDELRGRIGRLRARLAG
ncbi:MAG TPA: dynamin family protein [Chloroflexota bacterium]